MKKTQSFMLVMASFVFLLFLAACENPANTNGNSGDTGGSGESSDIAGYTVNYHANQYSDGPAPIDSTAYSEGDAAIVLRMDPMAWDEYGEDGTTYLGTYNFVGWNTQVDGLGASYHPDRSLIVTEDVTLYARWTLDARYRLRIGSAGDITWSNDSNWYLPGDTVPLPPGDILPVPNGYAFVGWENFWSGDAFAAGEVVTITASSNQNTYLARYEKESYTLTVDLQGGSWPGDNLGTVFTIEYDTPFSDIISVDPVMTSANFQWWEMYFPEDDSPYWDTIQLDTTKMPARAVELRAVFEPFVVF